MKSIPKRQTKKARNTRSNVIQFPVPVGPDPYLNGTSLDITGWISGTGGRTFYYDEETKTATFLNEDQQIVWELRRVA